MKYTKLIVDTSNALELIAAYTDLHENPPVFKNIKVEPNQTEFFENTDLIFVLAVYRSIDFLVDRFNRMAKTDRFRYIKIYAEYDQVNLCILYGNSDDDIITPNPISKSILYEFCIYPMVSSRSAWVHTILLPFLHNAKNRVVPLALVDIHNKTADIFFNDVNEDAIPGQASVQDLVDSFIRA